MVKTAVSTLTAHLRHYASTSRPGLSALGMTDSQPIRTSG